MRNLKIAKQFDALLTAVDAGEPGDLTNVPPSPTRPVNVQTLGVQTQICARGIRGGLPPGNDPVRYPHPLSIFRGWGTPLEFLVCGTPSERFKIFLQGG